MMQRVTITIGAIAETRIETIATPIITDGQILLRVESFALTANNITYAAMGVAMRYWDFFPASDGQGVVPVWGFAQVVASRVAEIAVGERVYGYLPMATHVVVTPGAVTAGRFSDSAPHRRALAAVYNQYERVSEPTGPHEDIRALFEPLFMTSWLIARMFARADWHGARQMVLTSASSKTALALAQIVMAQSPQIARIGLTSAGHVDFVRRTALYDRVLAYGVRDALTAMPTVAVDFAGNGAVLRNVHMALGDGLRYSCRVGLTHWDARGGAEAVMPGPSPVLFFAPDHVATTIAELGPGGFASAKAAAWAAFAADAATLVAITPVTGLEAAATAYCMLVAGTASAESAVIVRVD